MRGGSGAGGSCAPPPARVRCQRRCLPHQQVLFKHAGAAGAPTLGSCFSPTSTGSADQLPTGAARAAPPLRPGGSLLLAASVQLMLSHLTTPLSLQHAPHPKVATPTRPKWPAAPPPPSWPCCCVVQVGGASRGGQACSKGAATVGPAAGPASIPALALAPPSPSRLSQLAPVPLAGLAAARQDAPPRGRGGFPPVRGANSALNRPPPGIAAPAVVNGSPVKNHDEYPFASVL